MILGGPARASLNKLLRAHEGLNLRNAGELGERSPPGKQLRMSSGFSAQWNFSRYGPHDIFRDQAMTGI